MARIAKLYNSSCVWDVVPPDIDELISKDKQDGSDPHRVKVWTRAHVKKNREPTNPENAQSKVSMECDKCQLIDWTETNEVVALGRIASVEPTTILHHVPLGPHAMMLQHLQTGPMKAITATTMQD
ncbi:hypothetical protein Scep_017353 [Stephania cephalantha]|uniref:Uncharacterized protein n=1 Tax=Stephania cephalantha TaxID=152367 RepID=A0AAP0NVL1_9MAGN